MSISKAVQLLKGGSSKWLHETFPECRLMRWQEKYGAFTVSVSQLDKITKYIANQEEHHRKLTFQEELLALLKKHGVDMTNGICGIDSAVPTELILFRDRTRH